MDLNTTEEVKIGVNSNSTHDSIEKLDNNELSKINKDTNEKVKFNLMNSDRERPSRK